MRFGVLGSGSYGTAIGNYLISQGLETKLWKRDSGADIASVISESDILILGVPAQQMRPFLSSFKTEKPVCKFSSTVKSEKISLP